MKNLQKILSGFLKTVHKKKKKTAYHKNWYKLRIMSVLNNNQTLSEGRHCKAIYTKIMPTGNSILVIQVVTELDVTRVAYRLKRSTLWCTPLSCQMLYLANTKSRTGHSSTKLNVSQHHFPSGRQTSK